MNFFCIDIAREYHGIADWRAVQRMEDTDRQRPIGAGKSSFELIDQDRLFGELELEQGMNFLDLACGPGAYAIAASEVVGEEGRVYALDLWEEGIEILRKEISTRGIRRLEAVVADVSKRIPIEDKSIDICLIATVLHDLVEIKVGDAALEEVRRVLTANGSLAIIEFKKIDGPPGPPIRIRLSPEQVEGIVVPHGFRKEKLLDVGPYNYLSMFSLRQETNAAGE
jgi:ubiquinone/menaquinone biosynthesis C-methylase UbiE